jgi:hypothetical protein
MVCAGWVPRYGLGTIGAEPRVLPEWYPIVLEAERPVCVCMGLPKGMRQKDQSRVLPHITVMAEAKACNVEGYTGVNV